MQKYKTSRCFWKKNNYSKNLILIRVLCCIFCFIYLFIFIFANFNCRFKMTPSDTKNSLFSWNVDVGNLRSITLRLFLKTLVKIDFFFLYFIFYYVFLLSSYRHFNSRVYTYVIYIYKQPRRVYNLRTEVKRIS